MFAGWSQCRTANWWKSLDKQGWSKCGTTTEYLNGLCRNSKIGNDPIYLLEAGSCCKAPDPDQNRASACKNANWWKELDNFGETKVIMMNFVSLAVKLL